MYEYSRVHSGDALLGLIIEDCPLRGRGVRRTDVDEPCGTGMRRKRAFGKIGDGKGGNSNLSRRFSYKIAIK